MVYGEEERGAKNLSVGNASLAALGGEDSPSP
jgi:hypothetical protein